MNKILFAILIASSAVAQDVPDYITLTVDDFDEEVQEVAHKNLDMTAESMLEIECDEGVSRSRQFVPQYTKSDEGWLLVMTADWHRSRGKVTVIPRP